MNSEEIRNRFLSFFEKRGHTVIPSASLVPENDPSVLFTTAGMQPLVPYLLGEPHPQGKRLANVQKCVRTQDIDEVGDATHDTFFEMLGNWSLGDYFKEDAIKWSYELLTSIEDGFGLDPKRLYITVFEGDENAPKDTESFEIWKKTGIPENRIYFMSAKSNWWSAGDNGPCGPDTEMFYDITPEGLGDLTKEEYIAADKDQKVVEIWNDVFMEYIKKDGMVVGKLQNKNVDTGAGLERLAMVLQKKDNIFETDLFKDIITEIRNNSTEKNLTDERIVADHVRTATFMIADGVIPSNTDRGYILRRLIRRAIRAAHRLGMFGNFIEIIQIIQNKYKNIYPELIRDNNGAGLQYIFQEEEHKFNIILNESDPKILKELKPIALEGVQLTGSMAFGISSTLGVLPADILEKAAEVNIKPSPAFNEEYEIAFSKHQKLSRSGAEQKFKGGLAGTGENEIRYHTATHLLHQALRDVLGPEVSQKGSNITSERLRFDFAFPRKMTDEEKVKVENIVNEKISQALPMQKIVLPKEEAEKTGALHFFGDKYGENVSVYYIGDTLESAYSKEFCGGPHVENTKELGRFRITKEEAVSAGVRRIKAILE